MKKRKRTGRGEKLIKDLIAASETPDGKANLKMQGAYATAVLARGDLPPEIISKYRRMQTLYAKAYKNKKKPDLKAIEELDRVAAELLPYFHFKVDGDSSKQ